jgi:hypothetical protein
MPDDKNAGLLSIVVPPVLIVFGVSFVLGRSFAPLPEVHH